MEARIRHTTPARIGLALMVVGLLVLAGAYVLVPFYVEDELTCGDICVSPKSVTVWELSLRLLSGLGFYPIANALGTGTSACLPKSRSQPGRAGISERFRQVEQIEKRVQTLLRFRLPWGAAARVQARLFGGWLAP